MNREHWPVKGMQTCSTYSPAAKLSEVPLLQPFVHAGNPRRWVSCGKCACIGSTWLYLVLKDKQKSSAVVSTRHPSSSLYRFASST